MPDDVECPSSEEDWEAAAGFFEMLDENGDMKVTWNETESFWFDHCGDQGPPPRPSPPGR